MPQPDSSRDRPLDRRWNTTEAPWPVDPAAPRRFGSLLGGSSGQRPKEKPEQDGRTPADPDGNEELEREVEEEPASRRTSTERNSTDRNSKDRNEASVRTRRDFETEDTSEWVATERFTLEEELEDTWPVPARYLDD